MNKVIRKAIGVIGSIGLMVAAFYFLPEIQRKMENKLYCKMK